MEIQHNNPSLQLLENSFKELWTRQSGKPGDKVYWELVRHYSETHRFYHNLSHVSACLSELTRLKFDLPTSDSIALAIWFHDVIYDTHANDNEMRSAAFFRTHGTSAGICEKTIDAVSLMIEATQKHEIPQVHDDFLLRYFLDIDLAILGASPEQFDLYDRRIRKEYNWVPSLIYRSKRKKALQRFLERPNIFLTPEFHNTYEKRARENITRMIEK